VDQHPAGSLALRPARGAALDVKDFIFGEFGQRLGLLDAQRLLLRGAPAGQAVLQAKALPNPRRYVAFAASLPLDGQPTGTVDLANG